MLETRPAILAQLSRLRGTRPGLFRVRNAVIAFGMFGVVAAFATAPSIMTTDIQQETIVEALGKPPLEKADVPALPFVREERISHSDTYGTLARRMGIYDPEAFQFILTDPIARKIFEELRPGKTVTASTDPQGRLLTLNFPLNDQIHSINVQRGPNGLQAQKLAVQFDTRVLLKTGQIRSSFFLAADQAEIPDGISMQMADIFGGEIDFHRGLRRGDRFSVVYEMGHINGRATRTGRILAAEFVNDGETHRAIWFNDGSQNGSYYNPEGKSLKAAFLRSPIEFSRVTSGFSMRFHPILQTWRAHRGVDYAAPIGTPVRATSEGTVEEAGIQNGYGKLVVLRHAGQNSTLYGHLDGFALGVKRGAKVSQGQIIGYVGRTGWATGPHLHYEFRINDVQQDPLKVAINTHLPLTAAQLSMFRQASAGAIGSLDRLRDTNLAQLN